MRSSPRARFVWIAAAAALAALALLQPSDARACMHGVRHPRQDAILLYNDGVEVIVWKSLVEYDRAPNSGPGRAPPRLVERPTPFAWLLAVPSTPIAYEVVDVAAFEGTLSWARSFEGIAARTGAPPAGAHRDARGDIAVGETREIGEYEITPIRGTGPLAARGLDAWLRRHHFPPASPRAVEKYAEENATFLAVRAMLPRMTARASLRPLAIAFRTDRIVLPVRLTASEQPFQLGGVIFSTRVPRAERELGHGMQIVPVRAVGPVGYDRPHGPASIVAHVSVAAVMRGLVGRIAARVPEMRRLEHGSLALSAFTARPLVADVSLPDPTWTLGAEVPERAASRVLDDAALRATDVAVDAPAAPSGVAQTPVDGREGGGATNAGATKVTDDRPRPRARARARARARTRTRTRTRTRARTGRPHPRRPVA